MTNFIKKNPLKWLNIGFFFENQQYLLPVMLFFYLENGLSIGDYLSFQSISYILYVVLGIPIGYVADHFSKKYILITGCFLNLVRLVLWLSCSGFYVVLIGEIIMVMVRLFTTGMTDSYIYEHLHEQNRTAKVLSGCGKVVAYMSFGMAIASLLSPYAYKIYGIYFLLSLELTMTGIGILLLCLLPKTEIYNRRHYSIIEIKNAFVELGKNQYLRWLIIYNVGMFITTTLFVSTFQPLMKLSAVPVVLFGFIYFLNQAMRGVFSYLAKKFASSLTLPTMLAVTSSAILLGFGFECVAFNLENQYFTVMTLVIVCIVIGMQLANQVINISEIHKQVSSNVRATSISLFNMLCRGFGGLMLGVFKNISSSYSFSYGFVAFGGLFLIVSAGMWCKLYKHQDQGKELKEVN